MADAKPEPTSDVAAARTEATPLETDVKGSKSLGYLFDDPPGRAAADRSEYQDSVESAGSMRVVFQSLAAVHFISGIVNLRILFVAAAAEFAMAYFTWRCGSSAEALEQECEPLGPRTQALLKAIHHLLILSLIGAILSIVMIIIAFISQGEALKEKQRQEWRNDPRLQRDANDPTR